MGLGALVVLLIAYIALDGPTIAPRDPLQENFIVRNTAGEWVKPPFAPFTVPGFPLGGDTFGRDILSQLLWAVRPTMTLVLVVAALRLVLGIVIGLASGWSAGGVGWALDAGIAGALAAPVLFVALCVIAVLGAEWGVWAFILGLTLTGWAEAARLLREQTRNIKAQPYLEAARALGLSDLQLLYRHVLLQVMPLVWILLAFEVSNALLTTAGLGFLGYFINSIWIPIGDWTGIRASGRPELGQMLAGAASVHQQPWGLAVAGSMVFLTVLGFNLLGEGLRQRLDLDRLSRRETRTSKVTRGIGDWIEGRLFDPLSAWRRTMTIGAGVGGLALLIVVGGYLLWQSQATSSVTADLPVPGGHLWASERHDPFGTLRANVPGLTDPRVRWVFEGRSGFSGGPVVASDGRVYLLVNDATLHALDPDGEEVWQAQLPAPPVGAPALIESGNLYVADAEGGLSVISPEGELLWRVEGEGLPAIAGPVIGLDGTAYYPTDGHIIAVTVDGMLKWKVNLPFYGYVAPLLTVSPSDEYLFFEDVAMSTKDGELLTERTLDPLDKYFVGLDGKVYLAGPGLLLEWRTTDQGIEIAQRAKWDMRSLSLGFRALRAAGITPQQRLWVLFASDFEFAKMIWLDLAGEVRGVVEYPYRPSWIAALDGDSTIYMCGNVTTSEFGSAPGSALECRATPAEEREPLWKLTLEQGAIVNGGALTPGRLYVTTVDGILYAIESGRREE